MGRGQGTTQAIETISGQLLFGPRATRGSGPVPISAQAEYQEQLSKLSEHLAITVRHLLETDPDQLQDQGLDRWELVPEIRQAATALVAIVHQRLRHQHRYEDHLARLGIALDTQQTHCNPYTAESLLVQVDHVLDRLANAEAEGADWDTVIGPEAIERDIAEGVSWHLSVSAADQIEDAGEDFVKELLDPEVYQELLAQAMTTSERVEGRRSLALRLGEGGWSDQFWSWLKQADPDRASFQTALRATAARETERHNRRWG